MIRLIDLALRIVTYLALRGPGLVSLAEIRMVEQAPARRLLTVMRLLLRAGIVNIHRGPRGGFSLRRPADELNLREVVVALELEDRGRGELTAEEEGAEGPAR